jgi:ribonuclease HI
MYIFTDGSCIGKTVDTRKAGWGVVIYDDTETITETYSGKITDIVTNQRAELVALKVAIEKANENGDTIYSDSLYSIKCITEWANNWFQNGWQTANKKDVKHRDLIEPMYETFHSKNITLVHMRGHQKGDSFMIRGNNEADKLATAESAIQ